MRACGGKCFLHCDTAGKTECEFRAVNAMIATVDQRYGAIDDLKTKWPFAHRFDNAFLDCGNPLFGDRASVNPFFEYETRASGKRLQLDNDIAKLAVAA